MTTRRKTKIGDRNAALAVVLFSLRQITSVRSVFVIMLLAMSTTASIGQSKPFKSLKYKFHHHEGVFYFKASGVLARAALRIAGEREFRKAIRQVTTLNFIIIPKERFEAENVSVRGLKNVVIEDAYQPLMTIVDRGDEVSVYMKEGKHKNKNRYFLLIDSSEEVIAFEMRGFIDPGILRNSQLTVNK
ncbi:MAG TPA: DUF4252 domain-containing protein [Chryseosolibacter sp.]|nr:DUF4252 domain-containing protein [Chryseosolibacter sp.]